MTIEIDETEDYDGDPTEEDIENEDWIKVGSGAWDFWVDTKQVTTLDDFFYVMHLDTAPREEQVAFLEDFIVLPAYEAVPPELEKEINAFLDEKPPLITVQSRAQTLHNEKIGHRDPSPVEAAAKTDFTVIQKEWQDKTDALVSQWSAIRDTQIQELSDQIEVAVDAGDIEALASIMADTTGEDLIAEHMKQMMENAVVTAKAEAKAQGITMGTLNTSDLATRMENQATAVASLMNRSLSNTAATQALTRYGVQNMTGADVAEAVSQHLADLSPTYLNDMLGGALTQAQNQGRMFTMGQAPGEFYSSELLDSNTCEECEAIDGTQYTSIDEAEQDYPTGGYSECAGGPRCRGTVVAVYAEADSSDTTDS